MKFCVTCLRCFEDEDAICTAGCRGTLSHSRRGSRTLAGRYRLEHLLGRGGMGCVYAATDLALGRHVAVKLLDAHRRADTSARERFNKEAQTAARQRDKHFASTYDFGVLPENDAYIVMELLEGPTLRQYLREQGPLPVPAALRIAHQIARATDAAHQSGIVHGDLTPANIVLTKRADGDQHCTLVDFGTAGVLLSVFFC